MAKTLGYLITWTKGYDKRYCFEKSTLADKIKYVNNHNNAYLAI